MLSHLKSFFGKPPRDAKSGAAKFLNKFIAPEISKDLSEDMIREKMIKDLAQITNKTPEEIKAVLSSQVGSPEMLKKLMSGNTSLSESAALRVNHPKPASDGAMLASPPRRGW